MDIYGAEVQVQKLLNYVKSLSNSNKTMYQKSKDRLKDLANNCSQIVSIISEILQEEVLTHDPPEFEGTGTSDFNDVIRSMEDRIQALSDFVNMPPGYTSSTNKVHAIDAYHELPNTTTISRKQALMVYKMCLRNLASNVMDVKEAEDCSNLLWRWFSVRFLEGPKDFRYNMKHIPKWIRDIVIMYGYHVYHGTIESFKNQFYNWMAQIPEGNKYVVPFEIYKMDKNSDASKMTLTAVVLWDVLLDNGMRDLCRDPDSGLYPTEDCVFTYVGEHNSNVMNPYQHYSYDYSLLDTCNLTVKAGDEQ